MDLQSRDAGRMTPDPARLDAQIVERGRLLVDTGGWPWMQCGVVCVALDTEGHGKRYVATETGFAALDTGRQRRGAGARSRSCRVDR